MAKKKEKKMKQKKKSIGLGWHGRLAAIGFLIGSLMIMPTTILFVIAMIPTFVSVYVDKTPKKMSAYCVGSLNLAPTIAFVMILWEKGHNLANALSILAEPTTLMIIYSCAWIGWVLHYLIPPMIKEFYKKAGVIRQRKIRSEVEKLVEEWGNGIRGDYNPEAARKAQEKAWKDAKEQKLQETVQITSPR